MAKIIIEVDDEFIRRNADPETAKSNLNPTATGHDVLKGLYDLVAFTAIQKKIEGGVKEFRVSRDMMKDDTRRDFFDRNIADVLMLANMASFSEKEEHGHGDKDI